MITTIHISTIYECSLERAFKTPILCDLSKIHTGLGFIPKVTHTTEDEGWGKVGSNKKVFVAKSFSQKGGFAFVDHVVSRDENRCWQIRVDHFQSWMLGFYKFEGQWETIELEKNKIQINYAYQLHSKGILLYPFCWIFGKLVWKRYMRQILENVKRMAYKEEAYLFD